MCASCPFGFEDGMCDLIVLTDHFLSIYFGAYVFRLSIVSYRKVFYSVNIPSCWHGFDKDILNLTNYFTILNC